eukprot:SAG25_NODE_233_length_11359_cov_14.674600_9_plen_141_part_00
MYTHIFMLRVPAPVGHLHHQCLVAYDDELLTIIYVVSQARRPRQSVKIIILCYINTCTMVSIQQFVDDLSKTYGPCYRKIFVEVDPETGGKYQSGERNNLSQDQIRASPGEGNTYSLYLNHCPGLMCIDLKVKCQKCQNF